MRVTFKAVVEVGGKQYQPGDQAHLDDATATTLVQLKVARLRLEEPVKAEEPAVMEPAEAVREESGTLRVPEQRKRGMFRGR